MMATATKGTCGKGTGKAAEVPMVLPHLDNAPAAMSLSNANNKLEAASKW